MQLQEINAERFPLCFKIVLQFFHVVNQFRFLSSEISWRERRKIGARIEGRVL